MAFGVKRHFSVRERCKLRIRKRISGTQSKPRLTVFRSSKHIYAQAIDDFDGQTLAAASTLDAEVMEKAKGLELKDSPSQARSSKSCAGARAVGLVLAERAKAKGIDQVVFDRNGFVYRGRIQAIAEGARQGGLKF